MSFGPSPLYKCSFEDDEDIMHGFHRFLHTCASSNSYRVCFFVDALDELEQTHQQLYYDLIDMLKGWITKASGTLKICVSSREDNVFQDNLLTEQRIRLQDLTQDDMLQYTHARLRRIENDKDRERLVDGIVEKSDGIFLWVALVVKAVHQGLDDGRDVRSCEEELALLPTELNRLFRHLLTSVSPTQLKKACRLFAMVSEIERNNTVLSLMSCLYLDELEKDSQFAITSFRHMNVSAANTGKYCSNCRCLENPASIDKGDTRCLNGRYSAKRLEARALVQGCCKGLLEIRDSPLKSPLQNDPVPTPAGKEILTFAHRSIVEFLDTADIRAMTADHVTGFDTVEAISQLHLAEFTRMHPRMIDPSHWTFLYSDIIRLRSQTREETAPFSFLETLTEAIHSKFPDHLGLPEGRYVIKSVFAKVIRVHYLEKHSGVTEITRREDVIIASPLFLAAYQGQACYAKWKIDREPESFIDPREITILLLSLSRGREGIEWPGASEAAYYCFENLISRTIELPISSLWLQMIIKHLSRQADRTRSPALFTLVGKLIALFLKAVNTKHTQLHTIPIQFVRRDGPFAHVGIYALSSDPIHSAAASAPYHPQFRQLLQDLDGITLSLRELVQLWDFENKVEIIALIDAAEEAYGLDRSEAVTKRSGREPQFPTNPQSSAPTVSAPTSRNTQQEPTSRTEALSRLAEISLSPSGTLHSTRWAVLWIILGTMFQPTLRALQGC